MTWTQFLALFDQYGAFAVIIIVLVVVALLVRKLWPTITQFVTSVNTVATLPATLARIETDLGHVKHEVQTNSGGSLKDSAKVTERTVKSVQTTVRKLNTRVGQLEKGQMRAAELALATAADLAQGKPPTS